MKLFLFCRLHQKFPWYPEQLSFLLVNTDNNGYLSKQELMEASKASSDMVALQVSWSKYTTGKFENSHLTKVGTKSVSVIK